MPANRNKIFIVDNLAPQIEQLVRSLQDNNYLVSQFDTAAALLKQLEGQRPHIILLDWSLSDLDGKKLFTDLKANASTRDIPVIVMTRELELDERLQSLAMDIDDYVSKPFYPEEVVARIESILQDLELLEESRESLKSGFMGHLSEMNLVDLIQTIELGGKSGVIHLSRGNKEGQIFFKQGKVIDAIFEGFDAAHALTHMLTWLNGTFYVNLQPVERRETISEPNREILKKGTQLIHYIRQLSSQLPPLTTWVSVNQNNGHKELAASDSRVLSLFSEPKPIIEGVEHSDLGDIKVLEYVKKLIDKGDLVTLQPEVSSVQQADKKVVPDYQKRSGNGYSYLFSFFRKRGGAGEGQNPAPGSAKTEKKRAESDLQRGRIAHQAPLSRAELMLLREKLLAD